MIELLVVIANYRHLGGDLAPGVGQRQGKGQAHPMPGQSETDWDCRDYLRPRCRRLCGPRERPADGAAMHGCTWTSRCTTTGSVLNQWTEHLDLPGLSPAARNCRQRSPSGL
ncbi:MAG: hypothetical protein ABSC01_05180 [Verrucomicrobiota bacterium]